MAVTDELRVLPNGAAWQTFGRGSYSGVAATVTSVVTDEHGSRSLSAVLTRDPAAAWPDLEAGALLEYLVEGVLVWGGRIASVAVDESDAGLVAANLTGEGYQADLDDDVFARTFVLEDAAAWQDVRSLPVAPPIAAFPAACVVEGRGAIRLMFPSGTVIAAGAGCGVWIDVGPNTHDVDGLGPARRVVVDWTRLGADTGYTLNVVAEPAAFPPGFGVSTAASVGLAAASGTFTSDHTVGTRRYVYVWVSRAAGRTATADEGVQLDRILVVTSTAFEASGQSILKASHVASAAGAVATLDTSLVQASPFSIPDFGTGALVSPREALEAANALQGWHYAVDPNRRLVYRAYPSAPDLETVAPFAGATDLSIDDVVNHVAVEAADGYGTRVIGEAFAPLSTAAPSSKQAANPSFTVDASGWFDAAVTPPSTLARDTTAGQFVTSPAGLNVTPSASALIVGARTGIFGLTVGRRYEARVWIKRDNASTAGTFALFVTDTDSWWTLSQGFGGAPFRWRREYPATSVGTAWALYSVPFVATSSTMVFGVKWSVAPAITTTGFHLDDLTILEAADTAADRAGTVRSVVLRPGVRASRAVADALAAVYAANVARDQLAGTVRVTPGTLRAVLGGAETAPSTLLLRPGDMLRLARVRDAAGRGASHRDGRIVNVTYSPQEDTAEVALDNTTRSLDSWLARLGAISAFRAGRAGV